MSIKSVAERQAERAERLARVAAIKAALPAANNVAALRAQVQALTALVEELMRR